MTIVKFDKKNSFNEIKNSYLINTSSIIGKNNKNFLILQLEKINEKQ